MEILSVMLFERPVLVDSVFPHAHSHQRGLRISGATILKRCTRQVNDVQSASTQMQIAPRSVSLHRLSKMAFVSDNDVVITYYWQRYS